MKSNVIKKSCLLFTSVACLMFSSPTVLGIFAELPPKGIKSIEYSCQQHWQTHLKKNFKGYKLYECYDSTSVITLIKNSKLGVVDKKTGNMILPAEYNHIDYALYSKNNFIVAQKKAGEKYGVFNRKGEQIFPFELTNSWSAQYNENYLAVEKNKKEGLIDINGKIIIPFELGYDHIEGENNILNVKNDLIKHYYVVEMRDAKSRKAGIFDIQKGKLIIPLILTRVKTKFDSFDSFIYFEKDGKVGGFHAATEKFISPQFAKIKASENNFIFVKQHSEGKWGVFDVNLAQVISPFEYDAVGDLFDNFFAVKKGKNLALFDANLGKEVTPFEYSSIEVNSEKNSIEAIKGKNEGNGIIHKDRWITLAKITYNPKYEAYQKYKGYRSEGNNYFAISFGPYWQLFDAQKEQYAFPRDEIFMLVRVYGDKYIQTFTPSSGTKWYMSVNGELTPVEIKGSMFNRKNGKGKNLIISDQDAGKYHLFHDPMEDMFNESSQKKAKETIFLGSYDDVDNYKEENVIVKNNNKYGVINWDGKKVIPLEYDAINAKNSEIFAVSKNKKWGLFDLKGNIILPLEYDGFGEFKNNLAKVSKDKLKGMIDSSGKIVIPIEYQEMQTFKDRDLIAVVKNDKWGWIDSKNNLILPIEYDGLQQFDKLGYARVLKGRKQGMIDTTGKFILPVEYDDISKFRDGYATVEKDGKKWRMDSSGKLQPLD